MSITSELERFKEAYKDNLAKPDVELVEKAFKLGYMTGHKTGYELALNEGPHREDMGK